MSNTNIQSKELEQVLWNGADFLRGKNGANEYKTYTSILKKAYENRFDREKLQEAINQILRARR